MLIDAWVALAVGLTTTGLYLVQRPAFRRVGPFLPDAFLLGLALFAFGAAIVATEARTPEALHVSLLGSLALISGSCGGMAFSHISRRAYRKSLWDKLRRVETTLFDTLVAYVGFVAVAAVSAAFVYVTVTSSLAQAILSLASLFYEGALRDVRVATARGVEGYLAPGYIKQFRDILGPIVLIVLTWGSFPRSIVMRVSLGLIVFAAILVSGQRLALVILAASYLLASYVWARGNSLRTPRLLTARNMVIVGIIGSVLTAMTVALGRVEAGVPPWIAVASTAGGLVERATLTVPRENVALYDYWAAQGPTVGASWISDLSIVLPGSAGETISSLLHVAAYGGAQGNIALGLASDLWLAWGWLGVIVVPFFYAIGTGVLDAVLYQVGSVTSLATRVYMFVALPIMYSPYGFVLYGGAVAIVLILGSAGVATIAELCRTVPTSSRSVQSLPASS